MARWECHLVLANHHAIPEIFILIRENSSNGNLQRASNTSFKNKNYQESGDG